MNLKLLENVTMYKQNKTEQDKKLREHYCTSPTKNTCNTCKPDHIIQTRLVTWSWSIQ